MAPWSRPHEVLSLLHKVQMIQSFPFSDGRCRLLTSVWQRGFRLGNEVNVPARDPSSTNTSQPILVLGMQRKYSFQIAFYVQKSVVRIPRTYSATSRASFSCTLSEDDQPLDEQPIGTKCCVMRCNAEYTAGRQNVGAPAASLCRAAFLQIAEFAAS